MKKRKSAAEIKAEMLANDPEFKAAYETLEGEFEAARVALATARERRQKSNNDEGGGSGQTS